MSRKILHIILFLCSVSGFILYSCDPTEVLPPDDHLMSTNYGTVQLEFPLDDMNLPQRCIKRADLSISYTADSLYRKEFVTVANVSNYQHLYEIVLEPGKYYYKAAKTCICGGDTCLWGGYPAGQNGMKWTMGYFEIPKGDIIYDRVTFD